MYEEFFTSGCPLGSFWSKARFFRHTRAETPSLEISLFPSSYSIQENVPCKQWAFTIFPLFGFLRREALLLSTGSWMGKLKMLEYIQLTAKRLTTVAQEHQQPAVPSFSLKKLYTIHMQSPEDPSKAPEGRLASVRELCARYRFTRAIKAYPSTHNL